MNKDNQLDLDFCKFNFFLGKNIQEEGVFSSERQETTLNLQEPRINPVFPVPFTPQALSAPQDLRAPKAPTKKWTWEENERLIALKWDQSLPWKIIFTNFPETTLNQCRDHWRHVILPKLLAEQRARNPKPKQPKPDVKAPTRMWTREENERLITIQKTQALGWHDIAKHFPGKTSAQCKGHWNGTLKRKFTKRKRIEEKNKEDYPNKRARTQPASFYKFV